MKTRSDKFSFRLARSTTTRKEEEKEGRRGEPRSAG